MSLRGIAPALLATLALVACEREQREFRGDPSEGSADPQIVQSTLSPGEGGPIEAEIDRSEYEENAYHLSEGKTLYLPAGPSFRLENEIKNVITVVAKTHHYWTEHVAARV